MLEEIEQQIEELLDQTTHRPDPLPQLPWIMYQCWQNLLFISWPVPIERLRPLVPTRMELDTYNGQAWLTQVPMQMVKLHLRDLPPLAGASTFPEINLRTYVRVKNQLGVFFFSIDSATHLGAWTARHLFHLPYLYAQMKLYRRGDSFYVQSHRPASEETPAADFVANYRPVGQLAATKPGSLEHFLFERYLLFCQSPMGILFRGDSHHPPWALQPVEVKIKTNTVPQAAGFELPTTALQYHYSPGTQSLMWPIVPISL